jgi:DNA repair exonuclease SbcCD ATPase subunit
MLKMRDRQEELNKAVMAIRETRAQLQAIEKRLGSAEPEKSLVTASADLRKKMSAIEEELVQVNGKSSEDFANFPVKLDNKFSALQNLVDSADTAPTAAELAVFAELDQRFEAQLVKWREVLSKDLPAINDAMQKHSVPLIAPSAAKTN